MHMDMEKEKMGNAWRSACTSLLGSDVGPMDRYAGYLKSYVQQVKVSNSAISGKEVAFTGDYPSGIKVIANDEVGQYSGIISRVNLDMDDIKDIDSITEALREKICYTGNLFLGNSGGVSHSNRIVDSYFIYDSQEIFYSKYVAHSSILNYCTYSFGSESVGESNFVINGYEIFPCTGIMECVRIYDSSHCFYSANLENCIDCLYCFNLRSKTRCIGNIELPRERFQALKSKLLEDMRTTLRSKKELPSIVEIVKNGDYNG